MDQRLSLVTLAVPDLARATAFLEALGWRRSVRAAQGVAFFQLNGFALGLYPLDSLARETGLPVGELGMGAVTLAHNVASRDDVDALMARAQAAGATVVTAPRDMDWGGYSGYFRDPSGHLWELAWNPHFPLDEGGNLTLPE